jgi:Ca2+-binding RTX toxin-like protein
VINGDDGADSLAGGAGADILFGGDIYGTATQSLGDTLSGGSGTDYLVVTGGPNSYTTVEGGEKSDRLLIHQTALGLPGGDDDTIPMFTVLGGAYGVVSDYDGTWVDKNLFGPDGSPHQFRMYTYHSTEIPSSPSGTIPEGDLEQLINMPADAPFYILYAHYFNISRLEIQVHVQGENAYSFTVAITDFQMGDYGIELGPVLDVYGPLPDVADAVYPDGAGQGEFVSVQQQLQNRSDDISIEIDDGVVQPLAGRSSAFFFGGEDIESQNVFSAFENSPAPVPTIRVAITGDGDANTLSGNDVAETLRGLGGQDTINAGGGDDILFGGAGDDRLIGGAGADQLNGGDGVDTADYRTSDAGVQLNLLTQSGVGGDAQGDTLTAIENLAGSHFDDILTGDEGVNRLQGFDGNDQLFGGGGNDRLLGGQGGDVINGGAGVDTADYSTSLGGVTVNLKLNIGQGADAAGDTFFLIENLSGSDFGDSLTGDDLSYRLSGADGSDTLNGLGGIDYLVGGNGNDVLTGGAGADVYVFGLGSGQDTITDFWAGTGRTDRIQFTDGQFANFGALLASAANVAGNVVITSGDGSTITLSGVQLSQLTADDFIFS